MKCDNDFQEFEEESLDVASAVQPESSRGAWASLVLGITATLGWMVPIVGIPVTIVGIVLGAINLKSKKAKGAAIGGFVVNIVFLAAAIAKGIVDLVKYCKNK